MEEVVVVLSKVAEPFPATIKFTVNEGGGVVVVVLVVVGGTVVVVVVEVVVLVEVVVVEVVEVVLVELVVDVVVLVVVETTGMNCGFSIRSEVGISLGRRIMVLPSSCWIIIWRSCPRTWASNGLSHGSH